MCITLVITRIKPVTHTFKGQRTSNYAIRAKFATKLRASKYEVILAQDTNEYIIDRNLARELKKIGLT